MKLFSRPTPEQQREAQLLRQWRAGALKTRLQNIPLEFLLRQQSRHLEAERRSASWDTSSNSPSSRPTDKTSAANTSGCARPRSANKLRAWLRRRHCLQPARLHLVKLKRRLLVKLATWGLRLLFHLSRRGRPTT